MKETPIYLLSQFLLPVNIMAVVGKVTTIGGTPHFSLIHMVMRGRTYLKVKMVN